MWPDHGYYVACRTLHLQWSYRVLRFCDNFRFNRRIPRPRGYYVLEERRCFPLVHGSASLSTRQTGCGESQHSTPDKTTLWQDGLGLPDHSVITWEHRENREHCPSHKHGQPFWLQERDSVRRAGGNSMIGYLNKSYLEFGSNEVRQKL